MKPSKEIIFQSNDQYPSCHSVSLCRLENGDLLAAWFAGREEGDPDSVILCSSKAASDTHWSPAQEIVNVHRHAVGNPRLFIGPDGYLWLIAPINYGRWCQGGTRLFLKRSADYGHHWSDLEIFIPQPGILGKNKPIRTNRGTYIVPVEYERSWKAAFLRSVDAGITWKIIRCPDPGVRLHQPSVIQKNDGGLLALMRSWEGVIFKSISNDDGETWEEASPTRIPNNNSGLDMVKLHDGRIALLCNPCGLGSEGNIVVRPQERPASIKVADLCRADRKQIDYLTYPERERTQDLIPGYPTWGPRTPLTVLVSANDGLSYSVYANIEEDPGEFSYPAVIENEGTSISIAYTAHRKQIRYSHLNIMDDIPQPSFFLD